MMRGSWVTALVCCVAWRAACDAVVMKNILRSSSSSGIFCVTVTDKMPANYSDISSEEKMLWRSPPTISVHLKANVTRLYPYVTCASKRQLEKEHLSLGNHFVEYRQTVEKGVLLLALTLDGTPMDPQNCSERVYNSAAQFLQLDIFAKGPLIFSWDQPCPVTTRAPTTLPSTTTPSQTTKLSNSRPPERSTRDTTLLITSITTNSFAVTPTPSSDTSTLNTVLPIWAWIVAGAVLVAVIVIAVSCCYACARRRAEERERRRSRTDAEKVKQELLVDAKRQSYQEQRRWDMDRVDAGAVPASEEFKFTTFSDQS